MTIPYSVALAISDLPKVDEALRDFSDDPNETSAVTLIMVVIESYRSNERQALHKAAAYLGGELGPLCISAALATIREVLK